MSLEPGILRGLAFVARPIDRDAVEVVVERDEYAYVEPLLAGAIRPTVLDVGANIGLFSLRVFAARPSATVHAVEPSESTYRILERNRAAHPGLDWTLHRAAVWRRDGEVRFRNSRKRSTASAIRTRGDELVPALRLSTLLTRCGDGPVELLKLDVEGAEEIALCGKDDVLARVETAIVQVHPGRCDADRVLARLAERYPHRRRMPGASRNPTIVASVRNLDAVLPGPLARLPE